LWQVAQEMSRFPAQHLVEHERWPRSTSAGGLGGSRPDSARCPIDSGSAVARHRATPAARTESPPVASRWPARADRGIAVLTNACHHRAPPVTLLTQWERHGELLRDHVNPTEGRRNRGRKEEAAYRPGARHSDAAAWRYDQPIRPVRHAGRGSTARTPGAVRSGPRSASIPPTILSAVCSPSTKSAAPGCSGRSAPRAPAAGPRSA